MLRALMHYVADLHLHSKYSRAVSKNMTLPVMEEYARQKGIDILTASDWTHTLWFKEIQGQLQEAREGIYKIKNQKSRQFGGQAKIKNDKDVYFLLSTEISSIYKQGEKLRRIHNLVFVPSLEVAEKVNRELLKRGCNLSSDGRPIIGISSRDLLELILSIDERCLLIPCHVWTPHFGIYGSASGFDSLSEAFGDYSKYIYGVETGLSSDPDMNWQIEELMGRSILSFSDAHSPAKMGREATVFELEAPTYKNIRQAIMRPSVLSSQLSDSSHSVSQPTDQPKTDKQLTENRNQKTDNRIVYTIEFYPEEGKYHFSGHRNCKIVYGPEEIREKGINCPVCKRRMTEGVLLRVQQLASEDLLDRAESKKNEQGLLWFTDRKKLQPPFVKLVPLIEVIAEGLGVTTASKRVSEMYEKMIEGLGSELDILLRTEIPAIEKISTTKVAAGVRRVREGNIVIDPGYDGEFGKVKIWREDEETEVDAPQLSLDI